MQDRELYKAKLRTWILGVPLNEWVVIDSLVHPDNRTSFIEIIKEFIDGYVFQPEKFDLEFSIDYKQIRKIDMSCF